MLHGRRGDVGGHVRRVGVWRSNATRERKTDHLDKLIAAHAVSLGIVLVTHNVRDLAAYPNLKIENWVEM